MKKIRLDLLLVERDLVESRSQAQRLVMAGLVRVDGQVELSSSAGISPQATISVETGPRYVSRGGEKLEAALQAFAVPVAGMVCADVGASTGGFTDCLLRHGASKVYTIDVGQGILDWKLRQDQRVVVMEGTNARYLKKLPQDVGLVTIDVSFISLKVILPVVKDWFFTENRNIERSQATVIALVKPQFEAGRRQVGRGKGVIRDPATHRQVLLEVLNYACQVGYALRGLIRSPLTGPKGNIEFLAWLEYPGEQVISIESLVEVVLSAAV